MLVFEVHPQLTALVSESLDQAFSHQLPERPVDQMHILPIFEVPPPYAWRQHGKDHAKLLGQASAACWMALPCVSSFRGT